MTHDVRVNFMHPTDGRIITVTLDATMTPSEAVGELIANDFIAPLPMGYNLAIKGGPLLPSNDSFAKAGLKDGDTIRVVPATDAGGGIRGLDSGSVTNYKFDDLRRSPAALTMVVKHYEELEARVESLTRELESERFRSQSRLTAALLLLVAQVVLSVGSGLLPTDATTGTVVLVAGGLQAVLATYLTFREPPRRRPDSDRRASEG
jgi:hypothetical protein